MLFRSVSINECEQIRSDWSDCQLSHVRAWSRRLQRPAGSWKWTVTDGKSVILLDCWEFLWLQTNCLIWTLTQRCASMFFLLSCEVMLLFALWQILNLMFLIKLWFEFPLVFIQNGFTVYVSKDFEVEISPFSQWSSGCFLHLTGHSCVRFLHNVSSFSLCVVKLPTAAV